MRASAAGAHLQAVADALQEVGQEALEGALVHHRTRHALRHAHVRLFAKVSLCGALPATHALSGRRVRRHERTSA